MEAGARGGGAAGRSGGGLNGGCDNLGGVSISRSAALAVSAVAAILAALGLWWLLDATPSPAELIRELPAKPGATLFIDVGLARRGGVLRYFTAPAAAQDAEYRGFVDATGFDYARDLDRRAVRFAQGGGVWIAAAGRFDGRKLAAYAAGRGGRCVRGICAMQGSAAERQISWLEPRGGRLVLAVSPDPMAAALAGSGGAPLPILPDAPAWLHVPGAQIAPGEGLLPGVSALLSALSGAEQAVFKLNAGGDGVVVRLEAEFSRRTAAESSVAKLTAATSLLQKLLAREQRQEGDRGWAEVLASGEFRVEGSRAAGTWRLEPELLKRLAD